MAVRRLLRQPAALDLEQNSGFSGKEGGGGSSGRERMNRILALFRERDTLGELGISVIHDLLEDELFPGTSTIQTRLRYMLFLP
jgi:hypothetical protein